VEARDSGGQLQRTAQHSTHSTLAVTAASRYADDPDEVMGVVVLMVMVMKCVVGVGGCF
jgi:hypothetical protein